MTTNFYFEIRPKLKSKITEHTFGNFWQCSVKYSVCVVFNQILVPFYYLKSNIPVRTQGFTKIEQSQAVNRVQYRTMVFYGVLVPEAETALKIVE